MLGGMNGIGCSGAAGADGGLGIGPGRPWKPSSGTIGAPCPVYLPCKCGITGVKSGIGVACPGITGGITGPWNGWGCWGKGWNPGGNTDPCCG
jgi:hypothetical protein